MTDQQAEIGTFILILVVMPSLFILIGAKELWWVGLLIGLVVIAWRMTQI